MTVLVYGDSFAGAAHVFAGLIPYFLFTVVSSVMMTTLYATHREKVFLSTLVFGTIVLVISCSVLTALIGTIGGALGLSIAELFMAVVLTVRVRSVIPLRVGKTALAYLGAGATMSVALYFVRDLPLLLQAGTGLVAFLGSLVLLKGITMQDVELLREKVA